MMYLALSLLLLLLPAVISFTFVVPQTVGRNIGNPYLKSRPTLSTSSSPLHSPPSSFHSPISTLLFTSETSTEEVASSEKGADLDEVCETPEEMSESKKLLQKVKDAGVAGAISYAAWELGFWGVSVPVCVFGYREFTGHWPDFSNKDDMAKLGTEAFAFVNFARFAVPLRIGLALGTTPWVQENVVDKFFPKKEVDPNCEPMDGQE